jgi:hypothetical protein
MRLKKILSILILIGISSTFLGQSLESEDLKCEKILQEVSDNIQKNKHSRSSARRREQHKNLSRDFFW